MAAGPQQNFGNNSGLGTTHHGNFAKRHSRKTIGAAGGGTSSRVKAMHGARNSRGAKIR